MTNWHRIFYYLQFAVITVFIAVIFFRGIQGTWLMTLLMGAFYFTEFAILEQQRKMNKDMVFYRKSGFFALFDLVFVTAFLIYTLIFAVDYLFSATFIYFTYPFLVVLVYTLFRKIYIYKHYTYEK